MGRRRVLAGQPCLLPAPMDGVTYPQPPAWPELQYVPWRVLLVRPIGHPPRPVPPRAAEQRSRAYPILLRVLRWGRYCRGGRPQTPQVGSLACLLWRPLSSRPHLSLCGLSSWVSRLSWVGWGGGGGGTPLRHSWPICLCVCPRHSLVTLATGGGGWSLATPG